MSNLGLAQFSTSLRGFEGQVKNDHSALCKRIANELVDGIVPNTPVDTGEARGEWQQSEGSPAETATNVLDKDGGPTVSKCKAVIASSNPTKNVLWLSNRSDHIEALEDGHSQLQAPAGMVEITLLQVKSLGVK